MADLKITDLTELVTPADGDFLETVDVDDLGMAPTGTNKKLSWTNIKAFLKAYFDTLYDVLGSAAAVQGNLDIHVADNTNPHSVTAAQAGADPVGSAAAVQGNLDTHESDFTNPHNVTAAQAGADPSGSAAAVQGNLDTHVADNTNPHSVTAAQAGADPAGTSAAHAGQANHPYLDASQEWSAIQSFDQRIEVKDTGGTKITQPRVKGYGTALPATTGLQDGDIFFVIPGP